MSIPVTRKKLSWVFPLHVGLLILLGCLTGCSDTDRLEKEFIRLEQQLNALEIKHQEIDRRVDSLWDETSQKLAEAIPEDFPPLDRELFITARNADHIRMFMSFACLDSATQELVNTAGYQDRMLSAEMLELVKEHKALSDKRNALLAELNGYAGKHGKNNK